ncbi:Pkinase-domain-containing protein [Artomyces pyxidatus]|uniref:Pkinase-domain-containing protein n=1 Tax=Artomyces pyxidatus TaxID=48021 RepID=A0ACB8T7Z4_9AGAM|nr:Pkinase-domain-containing protein [Artomyces pyxidatus]
MSTVHGHYKRTASTSPDASKARPRKRLETSSPEEGEVDDASPVDGRGPAPPPVVTKPELKVKFPFKKKAGVEDRDARLPRNPVWDSDKQRGRGGGRVILPRTTTDHWEPDSGPSRGRDVRESVDRDRKRQSYGSDRSPYGRDTRRRQSPQRHSLSSGDSAGAQRSRYDKDRSRERSPASSASGESRTSGSRSGSRRKTHRLPPPRSVQASPTPPRSRTRLHGYESDGGYGASNGYSRGGDDPVNNWPPDSRAQYRREPIDDYDGDRYYRPSLSPRYSSKDYKSRRDPYVHRYDADRDRPQRRSPSPPHRTRYPSTDSPRENSVTLPRPRSPSTPPPPPPAHHSWSQNALPPSLPPKAPAPEGLRSPPSLPLPPPQTAARERANGHQLGTGESETPSKTRASGRQGRRPNRHGPYRTREEEQKAYGRMFVGSGQQSDYDATTKLGEGTFGEVHKAKHRPTGDIVALKRILMHNEKEGMPVTALREIKILKALKHPNIVELWDMFVVRSKGKDHPLSVYMVFPYMDHDLAGLLENERVKLQPSQIKLYMKQLLEGTEYMHQNHILHRDMKAANLLISNNGSLCIADFGLARSYDPGAALISETAGDQRSKDRRYTNCVVTRWYRPPELLLGARHYGGEIDLWGVGCVLGEMFLRHPILPGTSDLDQLEKIWQMCGTPNQHTWPNFDTLPGCEGVRHHNQYSKRLKSVFEQFGTETCDLIDKLLTCNPRDRITASQALDHDYFWTDPLPADPKTLPNYEASHEFDKRGRRQQHRAPAGPPQPPEGYRPMPPPPLMAQQPPPPLHFGRGPPPTRESFRAGPVPQMLPPISYSQLSAGPPQIYPLPPPSAYPPVGYQQAGYPPPPSYPDYNRPPYGGPPRPPPQHYPSAPPPAPPRSYPNPAPSWDSKARPAHLPPRPAAPLGASDSGGPNNPPRRGGRDPARESGRRESDASFTSELNYG